MAAIKLKWSSLLNLTELEFIPEPPKVLQVSDELLQTISWLTAATGHDRRILRCTETGALLVADGWSLLSAVETAELYPESGSAKNATAEKPNKGVLVATSTQLIKASFIRVKDEAAEDIYIPANWLYWYPHKLYNISVATVPAVGGTVSYVGITTFN